MKTIHDTHAIFANLGKSKKMTGRNIQHKETDYRNSTPDDVVLGYPMDSIQQISHYVSDVKTKVWKKWKEEGLHIV